MHSRSSRHADTRSGESVTETCFLLHDGYSVLLYFVIALTDHWPGLYLLRERNDDIMRTHIHTADGTRIYVATSGPLAADADATLVLLHGLCMTSGSWARTVSALRRSQPRLRVVAFDIRGHGRSSPGPDGTHTLTTLANDIDATLAAVAPCGPLILAGHSMGAMAILTHLRMYPATASRLRAVALISTAASELPQHGGIARLLPLSAAAPLVAAHSPTALEWGWDVIRQASTPFLGARGCTRPAAAALAGFLTSLRLLDETATLDAIRHIPALVMCGSRDHITPLYHSQSMCGRLARARLVTLPRAGHQLPITHPSQVAAELASLTASSLGRQPHMATSPQPFSVA